LFLVWLHVVTQPICIALVRCEDKQTRKVLNMVRDLYALDRIWKDIGTYRNQDYIAPNKAKVSIWLCHEAGMWECYDCFVLCLIWLVFIPLFYMFS
jgi:hypothetical protein